MKNKNDIQESVNKIIELAGGENNIITFSHCATRLRLKLKDDNLKKMDELKKVPGVMGLLERGGETQIVIGNAVQNYYFEMEKILKEKSTGFVDENLDDLPKQKLSVLDQITGLASDLFIPIIGTLSACGTLKGIIALLVMIDWISTSSGAYLVLYSIANGMFYFLPFFLAYTTANHFGGKPAIALAIASALLYPDIMTAAEQITKGSSYSYFGIPLMLMNYSSTVLPIIGSVWIASVIEKKLRQVIPDVLKMIFVPLITLLVTLSIVFLAVGPILTIAMNTVTSFVQFLYSIAPSITGAISGGLWLLLVSVGLSKAFIPLFTADFATMGYTLFGLVAFFIAPMGIGGSMVGIALRAKKKSVKSIAWSAFFTAVIAGITEPGLFGLAIPAKKPLLIASGCNVIGSMLVLLFGGKLYTLSSAVLGIPALISPSKGIDLSFWAVIICCIITLVLSATLTYFFGWSQENEDSFE